MDLQNNKAFLDMQINEKFSQHQKLVNEDKTYANYIKQSNFAADQESKKRDEEHRSKVAEYNRELQMQMAEQEKLRRFKGIMSEHEQKVNKKDIEAYINEGQVQSIPEPTQYKQPTSIPSSAQEKKPNIFETENQRYFQPKLMNIIPTSNPISRMSNNKKYNQNDKLYQEAEQNMNDPLIEQTRNVTYNRGYGYFNRKT